MHITEATTPAEILRRALATAHRTWRPTASDLADFLARQMPIYGPISREHARRLLLLHDSRPTIEQVEQAIIIAVGRDQVISGYGGATLRQP